MWAASWPDRITLGDAADRIDFDLFDGDDAGLILVKQLVPVAGLVTYTLAELADIDAEDRTGSLVHGLATAPERVPPVVLLGDTGGLRDGHHRAAIAERDGLAHVPAYAPEEWAHG